MKSYNKAADYMNTKGIAEFNNSQRKKYGDNYAKRDGYGEDYADFFDKILKGYQDESLSTFMKNNKNFKEAQKLVEQYSMTDWDDLAIRNADYAKEWT